MVYDRLDRAVWYESAHEKLGMAMDFLTKDDLSERGDGRYDLSDGVFASLEGYETKRVDDCLFESHRKFIDVQCILEGEEWIYVSSQEDLVVARPYEPEEDCTFYRSVTESSRLFMRRGVFLLLFPHEAHMPGVALGAPRRVRKVVVKLPVFDRQE